MKNDIWKEIGNTPVTFAEVASLFPDIKSKHDKISEMEKKGDLIRLKQGLYVAAPYLTGQRISEEVMANQIYGPSYISLQYALRFYGLIPERVFMITSMTTRRSKMFHNALSWFEYVHVDEKVFPIGVKTITMDNSTFLIASPEKALCDLISDISYLNLRYRDEILVWLEEDIRFDMDELFRFDTSIMREYAKVGPKKNMINQLIKIIET